jgi:hypothetical protein
MMSAIALYKIGSEIICRLNSCVKFITYKVPSMASISIALKHSNIHVYYLTTIIYDYTLERLISYFLSIQPVEAVAVSCDA